MPSSRESSQPRDQTQISLTAGGFFTVWATMGSDLEKMFWFRSLETYLLNIFIKHLLYDRYFFKHWQSDSWQQQEQKNWHNKSYIDAEIKICLGYDSVDMDGKYHVC